MVGQHSLQIQSLLDLQQFSDPYFHAKEAGISSALWPLFGQIWPMSEVLAYLMLDEALEERRVLEIGCGLGLPSLITHHLGGHITAADYHPLASRFLLKNTELNSLAAIPYRNWDWRHQVEVRKKFDLIIGSDLLYEPGQILRISNLFSAHLEQGGEVILTDPGRGYHRKFAREMLRRGFSNSWQDLKNHPLQTLQQKGYIFRFVRQ